MNLDLKPPAHFFEFKLVHLLTIILLLGYGIGWWLKHEDVSSRSDAQQTAMLQAHETRLQSLESMRNEVVPDIREVKTKLTMLIELVDSDHKKPELHK